jgi:hypothetical protein
MLADRNSLAATHRIKGIKEEYVMDRSARPPIIWKRSTNYSLTNQALTRVQFDAIGPMRAIKGKTGDLRETNRCSSWLGTTLDVDKMLIQC